MIQGFGIVCPQCRQLNSDKSAACESCQTSLVEGKPSASVRATIPPPKPSIKTSPGPIGKPPGTAKPVRSPTPAMGTPPKPPKSPNEPKTPVGLGVYPTKQPVGAPKPTPNVSSASRSGSIPQVPQPPKPPPKSQEAPPPTVKLQPNKVESRPSTQTSSANHGRFATLLQAAQATGDFDDVLIEEWMVRRGLNDNVPPSPDEVPPSFLEAFREEALEDSKLSEPDRLPARLDETAPRVSAFPNLDNGQRDGLSNPAASTPTAEPPMERRDQIVCTNCGATIHPGHKFCGKCGTSIEEITARRPPTGLFGPLQEVGKAKLVLIKGEGLDGISYHLNAREHTAGRSQGAILFPDDPFLSPRHANFFYRESKLLLRDEGSLNGVFVRLREPMPLTSGDFFLCGEEIFRFEAVEPEEDSVAQDGTYFFSSPKRRNYFRLVQILVGGREGLRYHAKRKSLIIGRERCDLNFPLDRFISGSHSKVEATETGFRLSDMGSRNGTFLRIHGELELHHGDYVFLGQQLLRVEITLT